MSAYRAAVWAAVSTRAQAAADVSLPDQVARGQAEIVRRGWTEAHPPLVVPGESRQTVISLRDAEHDIPQLRELLDLAQAGEVNLVVVYDTDRFRGLLDQVYRALAAYGCQLFSLSQPTEPLPPDEFTYYANDTQTMMIGLAQVISHTDINRLRRKWAVGMPARVDKRGLPFSTIPFGYRKPPGRELDPHAVPEQDPALCARLLAARRDYESGVPASEIARQWQAAGLRSPRGRTWRPNTILKILTNPFYAGLIQRNMTRTLTDPRTRKRTVRALPADQRVLATGKHTPLWTVADYEHLCALRDARARHRQGGGIVTRFANLVYCAECGGLCASWKPAATTKVRDPRRRYACRAWRAPHAVVFEDDLARWLRPELAHRVTQLVAGDAPASDPGAEELALIDSALAECDARRTRYEEMAGAGLLPYARLQARLADVDAEESDLRRRRAALLDQAGAAVRRAQAGTRAEAFLANYDAHLAGEPAAFNALLHDFLTRIVVSRAGITALVFAG